MAFDQTIYSVIESELAVNVCVNLTFPSFDILDEVVEVKVYADSNSMYLPPDPNFASELTIFLRKTIYTLVG